MSLDQPDIIDAVGTETDSDIVVLSIIDGWDWSDEREHLEALQAKINSYLKFIESGQICEKYPDAEGKTLRIDVINKHEMPPSGLSLIEKASVAGLQLGVQIKHHIR